MLLNLYIVLAVVFIILEASCLFQTNKVLDMIDTIRERGIPEDSDKREELTGFVVAQFAYLVWNIGLLAFTPYWEVALISIFLSILGYLRVQCSRNIRVIWTRLDSTFMIIMWFSLLAYHFGAA